MASSILGVAYRTTEHLSHGTVPQSAQHQPEASDRPQMRWKRLTSPANSRPNRKMPASAWPRPWRTADTSSTGWSALCGL